MAKQKSGRGRSSRSEVVQGGHLPVDDRDARNHVPPAVVDAFCAGRLGEAHGRV
jgi:hypothetical protein